MRGLAGIDGGCLHTGSKLELSQLPHRLSEPSGMQHNQPAEPKASLGGTGTQDEDIPGEFAVEGAGDGIHREHHREHLPAGSTSSPSSRGCSVKVPTPPAALYIQECVTLAPFPRGTWLNSDPEMSWHVPGSLQLCSSTSRSHSLRANKQFPENGQLLLNF